MLLERTVKVFRPRALLAFVLSGLVFAGSLVLTVLDPLGITTYVPEQESISWMRLYNQDDIYYYKNSQAYQAYRITDPEEIDHLRQLHSQLTEDRGHKSGHLCSTVVEYQLKNGKRVMRYYQTACDSSLGQALEDYLSKPTVVFHVNDFDAYAQTATEIMIDPYGHESPVMDHIKCTDSETIAQLMAAIKADCEAGHMAQEWSYHHTELNDESEKGVFNNVLGWLEVRSFNGTSERNTNIFFTSDCTNILAFLEDFYGVTPQI